MGLSWKRGVSVKTSPINAAILALSVCDLFVCVYLGWCCLLCVCVCVLLSVYWIGVSSLSSSYDVSIAVLE